MKTCGAPCAGAPIVWPSGKKVFFVFSSAVAALPGHVAAALATNLKGS
jgi:hypothetical protein